MYCTKCKCEYTGWNQKCPICKSALLDAEPETADIDMNTVEYAKLVEAVRQNNGNLTININATDIVTRKGRSFPYLGRGYAWTKKFIGTEKEITVELTTTKVARDRSWQFPYIGYGFAWEDEMQGVVSGNPIHLTSKKVVREKKIGFPYRGFGQAWVQSMRGKCGESLEATLTVTDVRRRKKWGFPYFGFGYAWANAGELKLSLAS